MPEFQTNLNRACRDVYDGSDQGWEYKVWDEKNIDSLVQEFFPHYYEAFNDLQYMILKIDIAKYMIQYVYGGAYLDMDMECLRPLDSLLEKYPTAAIMVSEASLPPLADNPINRMIEALEKHHFGSVNNGIIVSEAQHPFFLFVLEKDVSFCVAVFFRDSVLVDCAAIVAA